MAKFKDSKSRQLYQKAVKHFKPHFNNDTIASSQHNRYGWHFWTDVAEFVKANADSRIQVELIVCSALAALQIAPEATDDCHHHSESGSFLNAIYMAGRLAGITEISEG